MKAKKFLSVILSLAMLCACATVSYALSNSAETGLVKNSTTQQTYSTLKEAFENVLDGDTISLQGDVTVNETISVDASKFKNITLDGNNNKITLNLTADDATGDGFRFVNMTGDTKINIEDVTIDGKARIGINFQGAGNANLTNVKATGEYFGGWESNGKRYTWGAVNWGNNCGGTVTDCDIIAGFANGDYNYPLTLKGSTKIGTLVANPIQGAKAGSVKIKAEADGDKKPEISNLIIGKYNDKASTVMIDQNVWQYVKATEVSGGYTLVAEVSGVKYTPLADAFAALKGGETITLLDDVTINEKIWVKDGSALDGFTFNGNNKKITLNLNTDTIAMEFGDSDNAKYFKGMTVKDLTIDGTARNAFFLTGGKSTNMENVKITGTYYSIYGAINFYGTHGGTLKDCEIVSLFTNGSSSNPLTLEGTTKVTKLFANASKKKEDTVKVYIKDSASVENLTTGIQDGIVQSTIMIDPAAWSHIENVNCESELPFAAEVNGVKYVQLSDACDAAKANNGTVKACMGANNIDEIFGKIFYINNMEKVNGNYRIGLFATVKNLDFDSVGFDITVGNFSYEQKTTKVYSDINVTDSDKVSKSYTPVEFGGEYIFGQFVQLPEEYKDAQPKFTPFAIFNGTKVSGSQYTVDSIYNK